ncbi:MAG: hypothetical protein QF842_07150 [Candidatus Marinimicrobia bacterium]|jgi:uncharacterized membrane protein YkvA (DUF1232 family)|nr:hypothetical protein [Candidatus Neomarinimicrobiota bacterium]MDP6611032.1 hypothetical protein [Candidatus Neomarinimicrobiota bacterium]|tara:strand:- start:63523 stop:63909 length:387 start_codon:yes stop_codon:yes gene_type:complete
MKLTDQPQLTSEDKERYEKRIAAIDLKDIPFVLNEVPQKIERLVANPTLLDYQLVLVTDISKLHSILRDLPELSKDLQKRIVFALEYFLEEYDEIPDSTPRIGLLDDYVLARWVVDNIMTDYSDIIEA